MPSFDHFKASILQKQAQDTRIKITETLFEKVNSKQPKDSSIGKWLATQLLHEYNTAGNKHEMDLFTYVDSQNKFLCGGDAKIRTHIQYKTPKRTYIFSHAPLRTQKNIWKATQKTLNSGQEMGDGSEEGLLQKEEEEKQMEREQEGAWPSSSLNVHHVLCCPVLFMTIHSRQHPHRRDRSLSSHP